MKDFLRKVIMSDSKESSKRVMGLWTMVLITVVSLIIVWKNPTERIILLSTLIGLLLTLSGIGAYEKVKKSKDEDKQIRELERSDEK